MTALSALVGLLLLSLGALALSGAVLFASARGLARERWTVITALLSMMTALALFVAGGALVVDFALTPVRTAFGLQELALIAAALIALLVSGASVSLMLRSRSREQQRHNPLDDPEEASLGVPLGSDARPSLVLPPMQRGH